MESEELVEEIIISRHNLHFDIVILMDPNFELCLLLLLEDLYPHKQ